MGCSDWNSLGDFKSGKACNMISLPIHSLATINCYGKLNGHEAMRLHRLCLDVDFSYGNDTESVAHVSPLSQICHTFSVRFSVTEQHYLSKSSQ